MATRRTRADNSSGTFARDRYAFTLIEVLLVLVIIAVASAVVLPRLSAGIERAGFENEVARISLFLRECRREATRRSQELVVRYEPGSGRLVRSDDKEPLSTGLALRMERAEGEAGEDGGSYGRETREDGREEDEGPYGREDGGEAEETAKGFRVVFLANGRTAHVVFAVSDDKGHRARIEMDPLLGRPSVLEAR